MTRGENVVEAFNDMKDGCGFNDKTLATMIDLVIENAEKEAFNKGYNQAKNDASWANSQWGA